MHAVEQRGRAMGARRGLVGGTVLVAALLVGASLGWLIDHQFGCAPRATVVLGAAFIAAGLWLVAKDAA